jgi:hypothetical protein
MGPLWLWELTTYEVTWYVMFLVTLIMYLDTFVTKILPVNSSTILYYVSDQIWLQIGNKYS